MKYQIHINTSEVSQALKTLRCIIGEVHSTEGRLRFWGCITEQICRIQNVIYSVTMAIREIITFQRDDKSF